MREFKRQDLSHSVTIMTEVSPPLAQFFYPVESRAQKERWKTILFAYGRMLIGLHSIAGVLLLVNYLVILGGEVGIVLLDRMAVFSFFYFLVTGFLLVFIIKLATSKRIGKATFWTVVICTTVLFPAISLLGPYPFNLILDLLLIFYGLLLMIARHHLV